MDSPEQWRESARGKKAVAEQFCNDKKHAREAWFNAGLAIEFALKAVIMKRARFNQWPTREANPKLHTHNLRLLLQYAGIDPKSLTREQRANLKIVLDWDRSHDYEYARMPRSMAKQMCSAAFDPSDGIFEWLMKL